MSKKKSKKKENFADSADNVIKSVIVVSLGSFMFFFVVMVASFGNIVDSARYSASDTPVVLGASTAPVATGEIVEAKINNANLGEGVLELHFDQPSTVTGAEFHFLVDGNVDFRGIVCSSEFKCIEEVGDSTYHLTLFRLPDLADVPLSGTVKVATILYAEDTSGELIGNDPFTLPSQVLALGDDENLLTTDIFYLALGRRTF